MLKVNLRERIEKQISFLKEKRKYFDLVVIIGAVFFASQFLFAVNSGNLTLATTPAAIDQFMDGSGQVIFYTTVKDSGLADTKLKVEYSDDNGLNFYDAEIAVVEPMNGTVDLDNSKEYQIGSIDPIDTSRGDVMIMIVWDSKSVANGNGSLAYAYHDDIMIKVTPSNDLIEEEPAEEEPAEEDPAEEEPDEEAPAEEDPVEAEPAEEDPAEEEPDEEEPVEEESVEEEPAEGEPTEEDPDEEEPAEEEPTEEEPDEESVEEESIEENIVEVIEADSSAIVVIAADLSETITETINQLNESDIEAVEIIELNNDAIEDTDDSSTEDSGTEDYEELMGTADVSGILINAIEVVEENLEEYSMQVNDNDINNNDSDWLTTQEGIPGISQKFSLDNRAPAVDLWSFGSGGENLTLTFSESMNRQSIPDITKIALVNQAEDLLYNFVNATTTWVNHDTLLIKSIVISIEGEEFPLTGRPEGIGEGFDLQILAGSQITDIFGNAVYIVSEEPAEEEPSKEEPVEEEEPEEEPVEEEEPIKEEPEEPSTIKKILRRIFGRGGYSCEIMPYSQTLQKGQTGQFFVTLDSADPATSFNLFAGKLPVGVLVDFEQSSGQGSQAIGFNLSISQTSQAGSSRIVIVYEASPANKSTITNFCLLTLVVE